MTPDPIAAPEDGRALDGNGIRFLRYRRYLNIRGGIERLLAESGAELVRRGAPTTVVSANAPSGYFAGEGVRVVRAVQRHTPLGAVSPALVAELVRARPTVVEVHGLNSRSALVQLSVPSVRLIYTYMHADTAESDRAGMYAERIRVAYRWADAVVLMTPGERDVIESLTGETLHRSFVLPPGASFTAPASQRDRNVILVVSRLEQAKRVDAVIDAASAAGRLDSLRIVGDGSQRSALEDMIRTRGGTPETIIRGRVPDRELGDLYGRARVLVSMSESESYGITLSEALAAGAAVVASDIAAHRSALRGIDDSVDHSQLVDPGDVRALVGHLIDPPQLPTRGINGRSWSDFTDELLGHVIRLKGEGGCRRRHRA